MCGPPDGHEALGSSLPRVHVVERADPEPERGASHHRRRHAPTEQAGERAGGRAAESSRETADGHPFTSTARRRAREIHAGSSFEVVSGDGSRPATVRRNGSHLQRGFDYLRAPSTWETV